MILSVLPSDIELVARLKQRDQTALALVFERYGRTVYNLAHRLMGNPQDAEDLTQDAFLKAYREIGSLREAERLGAWLYRLTHNLCFDELARRKRRKPALELDAGDGEQGEETIALEDTRAAARPERRLEVREVQEKVERAARALPLHYRTALALREMEGLSYGDIAQALNTSVPAVETLLFRARSKFREEFLNQHLPPARGDCTRYAPYLSAWHDDALPPKRRTRVAAHLEQCRDCRRALEELDATARAYRALAPLAPPLALKTCLLAKLAALTTATAPATFSFSLGSAVVTAVAVITFATGAAVVENFATQSSPLAMEASAPIPLRSASGTNASNLQSPISSLEPTASAPQSLLGLELPTPNVAVAEPTIESAAPRARVMDDEPLARRPFSFRSEYIASQGRPTLPRPHVQMTVAAALQDRAQAAMDNIPALADPPARPNILPNPPPLPTLPPLPQPSRPRPHLRLGNR